MNAPARTRYKLSISAIRPGAVSAAGVSAAVVAAAHVQSLKFCGHHASYGIEDLVGLHKV